MALKTIADLNDELTDQIPGAAQAKVVRAANKVIRRIYAEAGILEYGTVTTKAKVTTGTVQVTQDSTTAEFSGTPLATTDPLVLIQIEGDSSWFKLTPVDTNTGTLSSVWAAANNATATYTIVYPAISFPSYVGEIRRLWREPEDDIRFCADRGSEWLMTSVTGTPTRWSPYIYDSTAASPNDDLLRVLLTPAPETREVLQVSYFRRQTLLTPGGADTQTIPLPDVWWECVIAGTLFFLWDQRDKQDRSDFWRMEYERTFQRTRGTLMPSAAITPRVRRHLTVFSPNPENA